MLFEWDETKRLSNLDKHGLDFQDAPLIFDGRPALHVPAKHHEEPRFLSIAVIREKSFTVVWTWRESHRRIISFRRSRHEEESAYH